MNIEYAPKGEKENIDIIASDIDMAEESLLYQTIQTFSYFH